MMLITLWRSWNVKTETWDHNHMEEGHNSADAPEAATDDQRKAWKQKKWKKVFGYLNDDNQVIVVCENE